MIVYLQDLLKSRTINKPSQEPLILCECGCNRVYGASQMILLGNANGGFDRIFRLHATQIWGTNFDKQKQPRIQTS